MTLEEVRRQKCISQKDLATRCGCTQAMISAIEVRERKPSPKLAHRIGQVLGLSVPEIWDMFYEKEEEKAV